MKRAIAFFLAGGLMVSTAGAAPPDRRLSGSDRRYLSGVYKDTWRCLAHFVSPATGLPYDSSRRLPSTSTTNIGLYMAAVAVAAETRLIRREEAIERLERALAALEKIETFLGGFPVTWVHVDTLLPTENQFSTVDHLSNLCGGLLTVKGLFPELAARIDKRLLPMEWGRLYDENKGWYRGGWRRDVQDFDVQQKGWEWYYSFLGADTRFGYFLGTARRLVPVEAWMVLNAGRETRNGQSYFVPGWQGGGLFMQTISGLFLDERDTVLGRSAADFAWAQIVHARKIKAPVWGWSASESADGSEYLGWDRILDAVVTPHAAGLASVYYPARAAANLRALEKMGGRSPWRGDGGRRDFGFRDSVNWRTKEAAPHYLCLDQALLFLSLANLLHDGVVWRAVASDGLVQRGLKEIPFHAERDGAHLKMYAERDRGGGRD